jgi:hypothetical protein
MPRYAPVVSNRALRALLGVVLGAIALWLSGDRSFSAGVAAYGLFAAAWIVSVGLTDKYRHKYPYRYFAYLTASHAKAAMIIALVLGAGFAMVPSAGAQGATLWNAFWVFALLDFAASAPKRRAPLEEEFDHSLLSSRAVGAQVEAMAPLDAPHPGAPTERKAFPTLAEVEPQFGPDLAAFIRQALPDVHDGLRVAVVDDRFLYRQEPWRGCPADVIVSRVRVNDLQRINRFLIACGERVGMNGYFVGTYEPLEQVKARIQARYGVLSPAAFLVHFAWFRAFPKLPFVNALYFFITGGKNRDLSKASARSLSRRMRTAWVSGSPKRTLNSRTLGPSAVTMTPA